MSADYRGYEEIKQQHRAANGQADRREEPAELDVWDAGDVDALWQDARGDEAPTSASAIPPRQWLLGTQFCRGFVSSLLGAGGVGKSALRLTQYLALASDRELTGDRVFLRGRVLLLSLEDGRDELLRRVAAAAIHHRIRRGDLGRYLYCASPAGLKLAERNLDRSVKDGRLVAALRAQIERIKPDLVAFDPFIKTHELDENNNVEIDAVVSILVRFAQEYNIAVDSPHHIRKGTATPGDADSGRGGSSFKDGGRLVYTATRMSEKEAEAFGIGEAERQLLLRRDSAKVNLAPPTATRWFKLVGVPLGNGRGVYESGDEIQTVVPWTPPDTWGGVSSIAFNAILSEIDHGLPDGRRFSNAPAAKTLAAWHIVKKHAPNKTETQCREIITTWVENGVLFVEEYQNPVTRKSAEGLRVNAAKRPS